MIRPVPPTNVYDDPPRKNVLLLSCMDQRLLDNTVEFMNELNLQNRYDHVIFAGAAMGAARLYTPLFTAKSQPIKQAPKTKKSLLWRNVFFDHLVTAIEGLDRPIHDIFLLEHMDCGAYKNLHPDDDMKKEYGLCYNSAGWRPFHFAEATSFANEIVDFCNGRPGREKWEQMRIWSLLMALRGRVETLACVISD